MPELTNTRAERVRSVRALSGRSARRRHGLFLAEGPQCAREAVAEADVVDLYLTEAIAARHPEIVLTAADRRVRTHVGTPEVLDAMSPDGQGVVAVVRVHEHALAEVLAGPARLVAVLAQVRDPGNAGAVIRAADAAGADAVILTGLSVDLHNPKVVRSTAGSLFHLPVVTGVSLEAVTSQLRAAGLTVLAADGAGEHDLDSLLDSAGGTGDPDLTRPTAWVFGNEAWGLPAPDRALAAHVVRVPIRGRAESLNLATAAAVCLFASARAQR